MTLERRVYMSGEEAAWLADKIVAYGEYGNDAARMLRKLSTIEQQRDDLLAVMNKIPNWIGGDWAEEVRAATLPYKPITKAEGL